jgi:hypothetical protein
VQGPAGWNGRPPYQPHRQYPRERIETPTPRVNASERTYPPFNCGRSSPQTSNTIMAIHPPPLGPLFSRDTEPTPHGLVAASRTRVDYSQAPRTRRPLVVLMRTNTHIRMVHGVASWLCSTSLRSSLRPAAPAVPFIPAGYVQRAVQTWGRFPDLLL